MTAGSTDSLIGRLIDGRYQVRSRIARGGMATVYLATDLRLERKVAIKIMHGHLSDDVKFRERFIQEARSAARLANPNVVNVFDQGQDSDMAYLVMEYLPGITLRDLLQEHGRLTTEQTLDILEAVLAGLSAAHKAGIVHRDLKPENVLLADDGRIKIGDFGLARAASANTATGAALLGTIAYLSPELVTRGIADTRSDIYAVGIMTYEMVTGVQPFVGEQPMQIAYQHANDTVPPPSAENPRVPPEIDELVEWATSRDPEDRPRDARAMLTEVLAVRSALDAASVAGATGTLPTGTMPTGQRTMVFPEAQTPPPPPRRDTSETVVIAPIRRHSATTAKTGPIQQLGATSAARRRRGRWILPVVIILALIAAGAGWYFGLGPGARATVPTLAGDSISEARAALVDAGLVPRQQTISAPDVNVANGAVSGTDPKVGKSLAKGAKVTIIVSTGAPLIPMASGLTGLSESAASDKIVAARFTVASKPIQQFSATVTKGLVVDYLDTNGKSLIAATRYYEKRAVTLVLSAGALPAVSNLSITDATTALKNAGLEFVSSGENAYSNTVKSGQVVGIQAQKNADGSTRVYRVGDTNPVLLTISKGPQPTLVPSVAGMSWPNAKAKLLAAGFHLNYDKRADGALFSPTVQSTNPSGGTLAPYGSTITVTFVAG